MRRGPDKVGVDLKDAYRKAHPEWDGTLENLPLNADGTVSVTIAGEKNIKKVRVAELAIGGAEGKMKPVRAKKRSIQDHEEDLVLIANLYTLNKSQLEITQELNKAREGKYSLSMKTVAQDIVEVLARWQRAYTSSIEQQVGIELAKLARMESELWDAWAISKLGDYELNSGEVSGANSMGDEPGEDAPAQPSKIPDGGKQGAMSKSKSFVRTRKSEKIVRKGPNAEYMKLLLDVSKQRAQLLGLITNKSQVTVDWRKEAQASGMDPDRVIDMITDAIVNGKTLPQGMIDGTARDAD